MPEKYSIDYPFTGISFYSIHAYSFTLQNLESTSQTSPESPNPLQDLVTEQCHPCSLQTEKCTLHTNTRESFHHICCRIKSDNQISKRVLCPHRGGYLLLKKCSNRLKSAEASSVLSDKKGKKIDHLSGFSNFWGFFSFNCAVILYCSSSSPRTFFTLCPDLSLFCSQLAAGSVMIKALIVHGGPPLFSTVFVSAE